MLGWLGDRCGASAIANWSNNSIVTPIKYLIFKHFPFDRNPDLLVTYRLRPCIEVNAWKMHIRTAAGLVFVLLSRVYQSAGFIVFEPFRFIKCCLAGESLQIIPNDQYYWFMNPYKTELHTGPIGAHDRLV